MAWLRGKLEGEDCGTSRAKEVGGWVRVAIGPDWSKERKEGML